MAAYDGPVMDIDVHHAPASEADLIPYLAPEWREYAEACLKQRMPFQPRRATTSNLVESGGMIREIYSREIVDLGVAPGSTYEIMREALLDTCDIRRVLLMYNLGNFAHQPNPWFGAALCRAANDWTCEQWLALDERLYSGIVVSPALPEEAAKEIRRLADHPKLDAVLILGDPVGRGLGDPIHDPIFRAAAEANLTIVIHPTIEPTIGHPGTTNESVSQVNLRGPVDTASLVVHGVFERYPNTRVLVEEFGVTWLPGLLWSLDRSYSLLKLESPWVKRLPSEYIHDHVKFGIQPLESIDGSHDDLIQLLSIIDDVESMLCFSTDYPHWSMDDLGYVARNLPKAWHTKLFYENACEVLRWPLPEREPALATA